jgi:hypothetical protein
LLVVQSPIPIIVGVAIAFPSLLMLVQGTPLHKLIMPLLVASLIDVKHSLVPHGTYNHFEIFLFQYILAKALPTLKFKELKEMLNITSVEDYQSGNYSKGAVENTVIASALIMQVITDHVSRST